MNKNIPTEILAMANSPKIDGVVEKACAQFDLQIDQEGELDAAIRSIFLGQLKSSDFTSYIKEHLEVDPAKAQEITTFMNEQLFTAIRSDWETKTQTASGAAGWAKTEAGVSEADRERLLSGIEDPQPLKKPAMTQEQAHFEPLVDQLLKNPAAIPEVKVAVTVADVETAAKPAASPKPAASQPPANLPTGDPYREPIN